jgi:preprotein translocase subunit SecY
MKLVEDWRQWSKWWSIRLTIIGGALLTFLEAFPHAVSIIIQTLPDSITENVGTDIFKVIGIVCIVASPIARVIKQQLPTKSNPTDTNA